MTNGELSRELGRGHQAKSRGWPRELLKKAGLSIIAKLAAWKIITLVVVAAIALSATAAVRTITRSWTEHPVNGVVLEKLTALDDFHAATATYTVQVDIRQGSSLLCWLSCRTIIYNGVGTDDAIVDFESLNSNAVAISANGITATVVLPIPRIGPASLDVGKSSVRLQGEGCVQRVHDFFAHAPDLEKTAQLAAEQKIYAAAGDSPLISVGESNTRALLSKLLLRVGILHTTVIFR
jgi:hypothetical protein